MRVAPCEPTAIPCVEPSAKRTFDRHRMSPVANYYQPIFGDLRFNASGWAQVRCVFHEDGHASLSIHRERGAFQCFA